MSDDYERMGFKTYETIRWIIDEGEVHTVNYSQQLLKAITHFGKTETVDGELAEHEAADDNIDRIKLSQSFWNGLAEELGLDPEQPPEELLGVPVNVRVTSQFGVKTESEKYLEQEGNHNA